MCNIRQNICDISSDGASTTTEGGSLSEVKFSKLCMEQLGPQMSETLLKSFDTVAGVVLGPQICIYPKLRVIEAETI